MYEVCSCSHGSCRLESQECPQCNTHLAEFQVMPFQTDHEQIALACLKILPSCLHWQVSSDKVTFGRHVVSPADHLNASLIHSTGFPPLNFCQQD